MENMEPLDKSIWSKTQAELTVADQYKVAVGATVILTGVSMAIWGGIVGGAWVWEKFRARKDEAKQELHLLEEK